MNPRVGHEVKSTNAETTEGMFYGFSIVSLLAGVGFLLVCILLWWFAWHDFQVLLFGAAMFFAGVANYFAFAVLHRMESAGYEVGIWRTFKDFEPYSGYWRIAPERQWSRRPMVYFVGAFVIAMFLLFSCLYADALRQLL